MHPARRLLILALMPFVGCFPQDRKEDETASETGTDADADTDSDADTDADINTEVVDPDVDNDAWPESVDCDDADPTVNPGADELCNGLDDDCDGSTDVGAIDASTFYADEDSDGFGNAGSAEVACTPPSSSFVTDATDCYDGNDSAYPGSSFHGAVDRGDGSYDYNCDGIETQEWPNLYACVRDTSATIGWMGSVVPRCGDSAELSSSIMTDCTTTTAIYTQSCY